MEGVPHSSRRVLNALALAVGLAISMPSVPAERSIVPAAEAHCTRVAGEGKQPENRPPRERCKRSDNTRGNNAKTCPEGGERPPAEKRSPLDDAPPLSPLVA
jgi:hypothetical protein